MHQALGGAQKMCSLSTYDSEGDEIVVHVTMKPHDAAGFSDSFSRKGRPLQLMASLVPRSPSAASIVESKHGRHSPCLWRFLSHASSSFLLYVFPLQLVRLMHRLCVRPLRLHASSPYVYA